MRLPTIFATLMALFASSAFAQNLVWRTEGVVFSDPTIQNVEVIPLPDGRYRMFLEQEGQIKSALSNDGRTFTLEEGVRLLGRMPAIVKLPDGSWRIYFVSPSGENNSAEGGASLATNVIKSAVSADTLNWTSEEGVRLAPGGEFDPDRVANPTVIALPGGGYRMYYDGEIQKTAQDFTQRILSATSSDGLTWTKDPGVRINIGESPLFADLVWSAHAEYYNLTQTYQLYFSALRRNATEQSEEGLSTSQGIYLATSPDGILFTVQPKPELAGSYRDPFVLNSPEGKRLYYQANGGGLYLATLKEGPSPQTEKIRAWLEKFSKERLSKIKLPPFLVNWQLYIVPTILLIGGTAAVIFLLRARSRR